MKIFSLPHQCYKTPPQIQLPQFLSNSTSATQDEVRVQFPARKQY